MVKYFKIVLEGLAAASGIVDHDAFRAQSGEGKTHSHAVVIVGCYGAGARRTGIDGDTVLRLFAADAHTCQLCTDGMDTVTFLETDVPDACDTGGAVGKRCDGCQCDRLIGTGGHVHRDTMESGSLRSGVRQTGRRQQEDAFLRILCSTSHFL